jgi:hypothetical protein
MCISKKTKSSEVDIVKSLRIQLGAAIESNRKNIMMILELTQRVRELENMEKMGHPGVESLLAFVQNKDVRIKKLEEYLSRAILAKHLD